MQVDDIRHFTMVAFLPLCPLCLLYYYYSRSYIMDRQQQLMSIGNGVTIIALCFSLIFSQLCLLTKWPEGGAISAH